MAQNQDLEIFNTDISIRVGTEDPIKNELNLKI